MCVCVPAVFMCVCSVADVGLCVLYLCVFVYAVALCAVVLYVCMCAVAVCLL